jgi:hypothetical protein
MNEIDEDLLHDARSLKFLWQERGRMPADEVLKRFPDIWRAYQDYLYARNVLSTLVDALEE